MMKKSIRKQIKKDIFLAIFLIEAAYSEVIWKSISSFIKGNFLGTYLRV